MFAKFRKLLITMTVGMLFLVSSGVYADEWNIECPTKNNPMELKAKNDNVSSLMLSSRYNAMPVINNISMGKGTTVEMAIMESSNSNQSTSGNLAAIIYDTSEHSFDSPFYIVNTGSCTLSADTVSKDGYSATPEYNKGSRVLLYVYTKD